MVKQHLHFEIEEKNQNHQKMVFTFPYYEQVPKNDNYYTGQVRRKQHKATMLGASTSWKHPRGFLVFLHVLVPFLQVITNQLNSMPEWAACMCAGYLSLLPALPLTSKASPAQPPESCQ